MQCYNFAILQPSIDKKGKNENEYDIIVTIKLVIKR